MGCWFSVGSAMAASKRGRDLLEAMPRERVLTETDGPFANVNRKALAPGDVQVVCEVLADCWSTTVDDVSGVVLDTFRKLSALSVGGPALRT